MDNANANRSYEEIFKNLVSKYIKREGIEHLMNWLGATDFYVAPASSRFHLNRKGGLVEHSLNVYKRLVKEYIAEYGKESITREIAEKLAIVSLFHDVCKVNYYREDVRNVKENGTWVQKPCYTVDEKVPIGHGEKSVIIIQQFMNLKIDEIIAINSHMGFSDARVRGGDFSITNAWDKYPLAVLLHVADLKATKIDESERREG